MEDDDDTGLGLGWHTWVAAAFALVVAGVIVWFGWGMLSAQLVDDVSAPDEAVARLVTAVVDGRDEGVRAEAAGDPEEFFTLLETALAPLGARDLEMVTGDVEVSGARGTVPLTWTVVGGAADGTSWTSTLEVERRRGDWQPVLQASTLHPSLRPGWTFDLERTGEVRAPIHAADGTALTGAGDGVVIGIEPGEARRNPDRLLNAWATNLPDSYDDVEELLADDDVNPDWFYPVVTLSQERFDEVWTTLRAIPGVLKKEGAAASPSTAFARHVLGRVDVPTAEMVQEGAVEGQPIGLYGLEAAFEDELVGGESTTIVIREEDGDVHEVVTELSNDPAQAVTTTLDRRVQQAVEDALEDVDDDTALSVVVLDVASAAIRASASRPLTGYNRAFEARYPPGDAALPVAVDALVGAGVRMGDDATCPRDDVVAGAQLTAPRPGGRTSVAAALGQGCDTTLGALAEGLDDGALSAAAERLGFAMPIELPLPVAGSAFPTPRDTTEAVRAATGQAEVVTSPLHVASMLAGAVNGTWRAPHLLVEDAEQATGSALSSGTGGAMRDVLAEGIPLGGTRALLGTAERRDGGARPVDAWAMTVVDDLAVVVMVEDAGREGPAEEILERLLTLLGDAEPE